MNWFVLLNGAIYMCAAAYSVWYDRPLWALVWLFYGGSAFVMVLLESQPR